MLHPNLNKLKGDGNQWLTRGLFADMIRAFKGPEISQEEIANAPYWLDTNEAGDSRPTMRVEYIKLGQLTGVKLYNKYFGGYPHFQRLMDAAWFRESFEAWQKELHADLKAKAFQVIQEIAEQGGAQGLAANKYIIEALDEPKTSGRGRPSKEEVQGELKKQIRIHSEQDDDAKRVGLRLVVNKERV